MSTIDRSRQSQNGGTFGENPEPTPTKGSLTSYILSYLFQFILLAALVAGFLHLVPKEFLGLKFPTLFATVKFAAHYSDLTQWIVMGVMALFAALSLYLAAIVAILAAAIFGIYKGGMIVLGGVLIGSVLAYLGRRMFWGKSPELHPEEPFGFYAVFKSSLQQFAPAAPGIGGKSGPSLPTFVVANFLGTIPIALVCIVAGVTAGSVYRLDQFGTFRVFVPIGLLILMPLAFRGLLPEKSPASPIVSWAIVVLLLGGAGAAYYFLKIAPLSKVEPEVVVAVIELRNDQYPDDPATRSIQFGKFDGRKLVLKQKDDKTHFDFVLEPLEGNDHISTITFENVDASLFAINAPEWTRDDPNLLRIALVDREWNRQQCQFYVQDFRDKKADGIVQVKKSDSKKWEQKNLVVASLARNCLNAGLWEVLLYTVENGQKKMYYHGWFQFPMGHYAKLFEHNLNNGAEEKTIQYGLFPWDHRWQLEHWVDPTGTILDKERLKKLRTLDEEKEVDVTFLNDQKIFAEGNQVGKHKNIMAHNLRTWEQFYDGRVIRFSTFVKPGMYQVEIPWSNDYWRMSQHPKTAKLRKITPNSKVSENERYKGKSFFELELKFRSDYLQAAKRENNEGAENEAQEDGIPALEAMKKEGSYFEVLRKAGVNEELRFIISGFTLNKENTGAAPDVPQLSSGQYNQGFKRPMGIGVPPFYQDYSKLKENPPHKEPYFSVLLDQNDRWIDHHAFGIDGPVMHRDELDPTLLHLYLLSYERHTLIGHWTVKLPQDWVPKKKAPKPAPEPKTQEGQSFEWAQPSDPRIAAGVGAVLVPKEEKKKKQQ